jgi:hypothetical protein
MRLETVFMVLVPAWDSFHGTGTQFYRYLLKTVFPFTAMLSKSGVEMSKIFRIVRRIIYVAFYLLVSLPDWLKNSKTTEPYQPAASRGA